MEFAKDNVCKSHGTYAWYRSAKDYYHYYCYCCSSVWKKVEEKWIIALEIKDLSMEKVAYVPIASIWDMIIWISEI